MAADRTERKVRRVEELGVTECSGQARPPAGGQDLGPHRWFYFTSVMRTLGFYGTVLVVCLVAPAVVALGISVFFLKFYRKEVRTLVLHPIRTLFNRRPPEFAGYSFEVFPPGAFKEQRPAKDESSGNGR